MDYYLLLKTVHIVSAAILFGTGLGTAFHMWMSHLSGSVQAIAVAARNTVIADFLFTMPAVVVQPATGVLLAVHAGVPLIKDWRYCSRSAFTCDWRLLGPGGLAASAHAPPRRGRARRRHRTARRYHRYARCWSWLGWP